MYFIPIAIWNGAPVITVSFYIWKSLIPAFIGNIVGGGLFVGTVYWCVYNSSFSVSDYVPGKLIICRYLFLTGEGAVDVDFNIGSLETAMEAGGPMGRQKSQRNGQVVSANHVNDISESKEGDSSSEAISQLPNSGGYMASGIGRELSAEKYTKRKEQLIGEKTENV